MRHHDTDAEEGLLQRKEVDLEHRSTETRNRLLLELAVLAVMTICALLLYLATAESGLHVFHPVPSLAPHAFQPLQTNPRPDLGPQTTGAIRKAIVFASYSEQDVSWLPKLPKEQVMMRSLCWSGLG